MVRPRIAITTGDPAGIGPEIVIKAVRKLRDRIARGEFSLVVLGSATMHRAAVTRLGVKDPAPAEAKGDLRHRSNGVAFIDVEGSDRQVPVGRSTAEGGRVAYKAIERAVRMALDGTVGAICTGPISKEALNLAGYHYSGHTELLTDLTGARDSAMLLVHGNMRVSHVSTHIALEEVTNHVTPERIRRVVTLTDNALGDLGLDRRRIAIAALNPHAGEGGLFGRHETEIVEPTIRQLQQEGFDVEGPVSGDTVFVKLRAKQYDAVVAMFHDQGHIPVKLLGFSVDPATGRWNALSGVNVTLGLPIIRTSVDHGTAFDIAGQGIASEASFIEAIDVAIRLTAARRKS